MPLNMTGILVVIRFPGDTAYERAAVCDQMNDWNINNGRRRGSLFLITSVARRTGSGFAAPERSTPRLSTEPT